MKRSASIVATSLILVFGMLSSAWAYRDYFTQE